MTRSTQSYVELCDALAAAGVSVDGAELHGGLCGCFCVGGEQAAQTWFAEWMRDSGSVTDDDTIAWQALRTLARRTWEDLNGIELQLQLLLPEDDAPIADRVEALAVWCHGFLGGLGLAGFQLNSPEAADAQSQEILRDFAEISRAALDDDTGSQNDESDFQLAELVEYVRVGVQILFEALATRRQTAVSQHVH